MEEYFTLNGENTEGGIEKRLVNQGLTRRLEKQKLNYVILTFAHILELFH